MSEGYTCHPGTPQWRSWRAHFALGRDDIVSRIDQAAAGGSTMRLPSEWPPEAARHQAEETVGQTAAKPQTPLSEGAKWLNLVGTAEDPIIDARGALARAGLRPSDELVAVTTRTTEPWRQERRWLWDDFVRKAPALKLGQHVTVEWKRSTETKIAIAIAQGIFLGRPLPLREEDACPFLQAHPSTRKHLLKWYSTRHNVSSEIAEAALRAMTPKELHQATLLADNEAAQPAANRHQVAYDPYHYEFKIR